VAVMPQYSKMERRRFILLYFVFLTQRAATPREK